ncbi:hypothetical protein EGW08_007559 [Elysia chlorotica]|uniref:G-protein coupled receptors family 1 profile domain-containing protein n=1 Tax=Elysia chlorotica TaxID=188477 RepID=A0A433TSU8_ELYCH|nr:hypothetical protein EGW08_007559 [Elysia chlorotica]
MTYRDSSQTAPNELIALCNKVTPDNPFSSVVSERLGRTSSKEQYGFMYRSYLLVQRLAILHAAKQKDILIAGDFNADESYVSRDEWATIRLKHDKRFTWLIQDWTDTTTGQTDRAYDRFVVAGDRMTKCVVPGKTQVFHFDQEYGLTHEEAADVSDHYPIEMQLAGKVDQALQAQLTTSLSVTVKQKEPVQRENDIRKIYRAGAGQDAAYFRSRVNYDDSRMAEVVATRLDVDDVIQSLREFQNAFPNVVQDGTVHMVQAYLEGSSIFKPPSDPAHPYIYGLASNTASNSGSVHAGCERGAFDVTVTVNRSKSNSVARHSISMAQIREHSRWLDILPSYRTVLAVVSSWTFAPAPDFMGGAVALELRLPLQKVRIRALAILLPTGWLPLRLILWGALWPWNFDFLCKSLKDPKDKAMEAQDLNEQGNGTFNESALNKMAPHIGQLISPAEFDTVKTCIFLLAALVSIFGICTNALNIVVFCRMGFSSPSNINMLCLAVADWLTLAVIALVAIGDLPALQTTEIGRSVRFSMVNAWVYYYSFSGMGSWLTALINVERACGIAFPFKVKRIFTRKTTVYMVVGMVIFQTACTPLRSIAFNLSLVKSPTTNRTAMVHNAENIELGLQAILYTYSIPTLVCFSVVVVGTIFLVRRFRQSRQLRGAMTRTTSGSHQLSVKDLRLIRSVIFICAIYIVGLTRNVLLFAASGVYSSLHVGDPYFGNLKLILVGAGTLFQTASCSVNIVFYMRMGSNFKRTFQKLCLCFSKMSVCSESQDVSGS